MTRQAGLDGNGELVAVAADGSGVRGEAHAMAEQMRAAYRSASDVLAEFGASLADVVQETIFALDVPAAMKVGGDIRKEAYGIDQPVVASSVVGTPRLAEPGQVVEISFVAYKPE